MPTLLSTSLTVLTMDDDPWFRALVRTHLNAVGHRTIEAGSVHEALQVLRREHVDVLLADLVMPEETGFAAIAKARQEFPGLKILAVSGVYAGQGNVQAVTLLGADGSLEKPFTAAGLTGALESLLGEAERSYPPACAALPP